MEFFLFNLCLVLAIILIIIGSLLVKFSRKKKYKENGAVPMSIIGWIIIVLTVVASLTGLILYIHYQSGITGTFIFALLSPLFILGGFIACLSLGVSYLVKGYRVDQDGNRKPLSIVRGWAMLILAIAIVAAVVITLVILFTNYSNVRGQNPIRMM